MSQPTAEFLWPSITFDAGPCSPSYPRYNQALKGSCHMQDTMDGQRRARTRRASDGLPRTILRPAHNRRAASIAHLPRVRFDSSLEDVRTFYKDESPSQLMCSFAMETTCVRSGGGTPSASLGFPPEGCETASTWFLRHEQILFSKGDLAAQNVHLDKLAMAPDRTLRGSVLVKNLTYVKSVFCRFTLDGWATFSDVCASYSSRAESGGEPDGYDRFEFSINQLCPTALGVDIIILCICFVCNSQSYWDNNNGANYNIPLVKETPSLEEGPTVLECCPPESGRAKDGQNVVRSLIDGVRLKVDKPQTPVAKTSISFKQPLRTKQLPMSKNMVCNWAPVSENHFIYSGRKEIS